MGGETGFSCLGGLERCSRFIELAGDHAGCREVLIAIEVLERPIF